MLRIHFKLMKNGIPAGNPVKDLCDLKLLLPYEVDTLVEISLGILNTDIRR